MDYRLYNTLNADMTVDRIKRGWEEDPAHQISSPSPVVTNGSVAQARQAQRTREKNGISP